MKKKRVLAALLCCILSVLLTACSTYKTFTFNITNGEQMKVKLTTTKGYDISQKDGSVTVSKDGEDILFGSFLSSQEYEQYVASITSSEGVTILETRPEDAPVYYFFQYDGAGGTETTFLFEIEEAETCAVFVSLAPRNEAEEAFKLLEFEKVK